MMKNWKRTAIASTLACGLAVFPVLLALTPANADTRPAPADDRIILLRLAGLRLVDKPEKIEKNGFQLPDVTVDGPLLLYRPGIYQKLQGFIGKPLRPSTMTAITAAIADWYKSQHRPFVSVSFPEQDISNGVVQAVVSESRVGHIRTKGNRWFSQSLLRSRIDLKRGDPIDISILDTDLSRLNSSPYRQVRVIAEPSDLPDATDLVLQTDDHIPLHIFTTYANGGVPALGRGIFGAGIEWANAFWMDQDLSYQFSTSDDFWKYPGRVGNAHRVALEQHQLTYTVPFAWGDRLVLFGNYAQETPDLGPFFAQTGINWQTSLRYVIPLPSSDAFTEELQMGFDFKRSNNNLTFGGFAVSANSTDIDQFPLIYDAAIADGWGRTLVLAEVVLSPGGLTVGNTDMAFQPSFTQSGVPYARARYAFGNLNVTRATQLPWNMSWILRANTQFATGNLLASEQLGLGGDGSIRGYDTRVANGPMGANVSSELRSPPFGILDPLLGTKLGDKFQADVFWDFGVVSNVNTIPGDQNSTVLQSAGGGVHYVIDRFVDLRFEYGWQLRRAPGETNRGAETILAATIGF